MTKNELIVSIAEQTGVNKKEVETVVVSMMDTIMEALKNGDKVSLVGFGAFEVRTRAARDAKNPATGEPIHIPETKVPAFKAGKVLKESVR